MKSARAALVGSTPAACAFTKARSVKSADWSLITSASVSDTTAPTAPDKAPSLASLLRAASAPAPTAAWASLWVKPSC
jgi:hypothetical protein